MGKGETGLSPEPDGPEDTNISLPRAIILQPLVSPNSNKDGLTSAILLKQEEKTHKNVKNVKK
jgi:hypothetical protein